MVENNGGPRGQERTVADRIRRIKACLNGRRDPADHPAVPVTPVQLAAAAAAAASAGAEAVHVHPRGTDGRESLRAADVGAAVAAIRSASPRVPVGVPSGGDLSAQSRTSAIIGATRPYALCLLRTAGAGLS